LCTPKRARVVVVVVCVAAALVDIRLRPPPPLRCYPPVGQLACSRGGRGRVRGGRLRHAPGVLRLPRPAGDHREVFSTSMPIQPCSPRDGIVTSAGWQVTPCDLLRHVSCRSDEARRKLL